MTPSSIKTLFITIGRPVISLKPEGAKLLAEYFQFLIKLYAFFNESTRKGITPHLYNNIHAGIAAMYNTQLQNTKEFLSKGELIYKNFTQLVMQNYNHTRNVAWYAKNSKSQIFTYVQQLRKSLGIHVQKSLHTWSSWMPNHN